MAASGLGLAVAGLIAMQSVLFTPILLAYLWFRRERAWRYIALATTPILTLAAWQLFERATSGVFPAAISAGYLTSYGYERIPMKLRNALALAIHFCFLVLPMLLPFAAVRVWRDRRDGDTRFLMLWILIFFAGACALFYSGSARYLLPLAAPVAILLSRAPANWVRAAIGIQLAISLGLATVNFEHWNGYRQFARDMRAQTAGKRVWVDAEWGLRHYFEAAGALPLHRDQWIPTGDIVVESELAFPAPYAHGGRALVEVARTEIRPWIPLRLIGLEARSGYSTNSLGLLPYDVRGGVVDRVRAVTLRAQEPTLSILPMSAPEVDSQVLYGIYPAEGQTLAVDGGRCGAAAEESRASRHAGAEDLHRGRGARARGSRKGGGWSGNNEDATWAGELHGIAAGRYDRAVDGNGEIVGGSNVHSGRRFAQARDHPERGGITLIDPAN